MKTRNELKSLDKFIASPYSSLSKNESVSIVGSSGYHTTIISNCGLENEDYTRDEADCEE
jgi:hypothetical protein